MSNPKSISKQEFNFVQIANQLYDNQDDWYENKLHQFYDDYDFNRNPSNRAKFFSKNGRELLNNIFNEWVAVYEAEGEQVWGITAQHSLGELNAGEQVEIFSHYLTGWVEGFKEAMNETNPESNV